MSKKEKPEMEPIDFSKASIPNLIQFKKILDQELGMHQDSLQTLKMAQEKYFSSKKALEKVTDDSKGNEILIPLTASIYAPGRITNTERVLIDVGAGYYIKVGMKKAIDYFDRKVNFVTEQIEKIQLIGIEKSKVRDAIADILESKLEAQYEQQQPAAPPE